MRKFKISSLRCKMTLAVITLTAVILIITTLSLSIVIKKSIKATVASEQNALVASLAREIDDRFSVAQQHLKIIAEEAGEVPLNDPERVAEFLAHQRDEQFFFDKGIYLVSSDLNILTEKSKTLFQGNDCPVPAFLESVKNNPRPFISEPFRSCEPDQEPIIFFAVPVQNTQGDFSGVLSAFASLNNINVLGHLNDIRIGNSGYLYLYNRQRTILMHPDHSRILQQDVPPGVNKMFDRALDGFQGTAPTVNSRGLHALSSFKHLATNNWILGANFPLEEAYESLHLAQKTLLVIFISMLCLAALCSWLMMRYLTAPINQLARAVTNYPRRDFKKSLDIQTGDELEFLAKAFQRMMSRITEQKKKMAADMQFLDTLLNLLPLPVYYKDKSGRYQACNRAFEEQIGFKKEDVLGKTVFDITPGDLAPTYHQSDQDIMKKGCGIIKTLETSVLWHDGAIHDVIFYKTAYCNSAQEVEGIIGTILDVTEIKDSYRQMKQQHEILRHVIDNIPNAVFWKDHKSVYRGCNNLFAKIAGLTSPAEIVNKTDYDLPWQENEADFFRQCDNQVMQSDKALLNIEENQHQADGKKATLLTSKVPLHDPEGRVDGILGIFTDITDRKEMEDELRDKQEELEQFMYSVSHDLKSPIITIKSFISIFEECLARGETAKIQEDFIHIRAAAEKLGQKLNDLLELSRIGRITRSTETFSFKDVAEEAVSCLAGSVRLDKVSVEIADQDVTLYADKNQLVEIWQNLLENAIKYMGDQPAPKVELGIDRTSAELKFFVKDNGMGIQPQFHEKIFELFEKLEPESKGTGLGLAMAKRIIKLYGGKIWVESAGKGQGACFWFTLPDALHKDQ